MNERPDWITHNIRIMRPGEPDDWAVVRLPETTSARYFSALRDAVEPILGGDLEHVLVFADFDGGSDYRYTSMFVHECGQLLHMPRNEPATALYRCNTLMHMVPAPHPEDLPYIAGPAILFRGKVWF